MSICWQALGDAITAVGRLADIDDRTPEEVDASKIADAEAWAATEQSRQLFDLWTGQGFGLDSARHTSKRMRLM